MSNKILSRPIEITKRSRSCDHEARLNSNSYASGSRTINTKKRIQTSNTLALNSEPYLKNRNKTKEKKNRETVEKKRTLDPATFDHSWHLVAYLELRSKCHWCGFYSMICKKVASYSAVKPSRALPRVYETNSENRFWLLRKYCSREVYYTFVVSLQLKREEVTCRCSLENTDLN